MTFKSNFICSFIGIILWIELGYCQEPLPEALGFAEPEALGFAEPEAFSFAEPESQRHYMLQKRSLKNEEMEDTLTDPLVEPESSRKKRESESSGLKINDHDFEESYRELVHYLGDGHDHTLDELGDDMQEEEEEGEDNEREKRTVLTGIALYQLGKSLEEKAESNGGTQGIPYKLIDDDDLLLSRTRRSLGSDSKLLNWLLDKKSKKEDHFRKYFVKGRYYYKPDSEFGPEDLEYLNYYSTVTQKPINIESYQTPDEDHHNCNDNTQEEESEEELPPPPHPTQGEDDLNESYEVPPPSPPPVITQEENDELEDSYEVPPPPVNTQDENELEDSYEVPPPPPPPPTTTPEDPIFPPPPNESYVTPPPSSYEIPLEGDHQSPIQVRPIPKE